MTGYANIGVPRYIMSFKRLSRYLWSSIYVKEYIFRKFDFSC